MTKGKKTTRLSKVAREFNVGISTIVDYLKKKGVEMDSNPNTKVSADLYDILLEEFSSDIDAKKESEKLSLSKLKSKKDAVSINDVEEGDEEREDEENEASSSDEILIKDVSGSSKQEAPATESPKEEPAKEEPAKEKPAPKQAEAKEEEPKKTDKEGKVKVVGKIDLDAVGKKPKEAAAETQKQKTESESSKPSKAPKESKEPSTPKPEKKTQEPKEAEAKAQKSDEGSSKKDIKVVGKIDLETSEKKPKQEGAKPTPKKKEAPKKAEAPKEKAAPKPKPKAKAKEAPKETPKEEKPAKEQEQKEETLFKSEVKRLSGPTVVGKIDLPVEKKKDKKKQPVASSSDSANARKKKKRRRISKEKVDVNDNKAKKKPPQRKDDAKKKDFKQDPRKKKKRPVRPEVNEEDVQKQIKDTLARLTNKGKSKGSKHRRDKREAVSQRQQEEMQRQEQDKQTLKVTEFISVNELANMMDVPANQVIATCMNLGLLVSINQRLDAETMALVADEFNYEVDFISVEVQEAINEEEDKEEDLESRPPIVTVMGHVDHGKTSLLDHIRSANVIAGEAGGITQHIGAYKVTLENGKQITFLDTPGHEAFTAMRARGAQITDLAIIVVAADDNVMPQTIEAINHASAAGVPIVFAINKIDKPGANPEKIKEKLANMNYMVEEWGGKYQSHDISAKQGLHIDELLEKVLLEAELLELKANPNKKAQGTVIESSLDVGRGYLATVLVQSGTMKIGDIVLAGGHYGHAKAMFNERGQRIEEAGPAMPVQILGLNGAPQAGDKFNIMESDKEAKDIAIKRQQLQREQSMRSQKHITLDEIGRRIAIGNFQEVNIVVKGDVDGSIEALSDSLIKLSNEEIQVNIIHKGVGQISESDVLLAAASNAIIIGFQVRPSIGARRLAEKEEIDIRLYSIIYDAINELRDAMEGMLSPEIKEEIIGTAEVRETFKIKKVGTVAGCMVTEGKIQRTAKVRVIREGIVIYTGELGSLKRFHDDAKEVHTGLECGLNVENFNDIKVGDNIEGFREIEIKKTL
ncbi:MAG: translation initiation factor IF-2 [Bacteroidales bacterium]